MKEPKINYEEEIRKCKTMDDIVGKNGLMQKLLKDGLSTLFMFLYGLSIRYRYPISI